MELINIACDIIDIIFITRLLFIALKKWVLTSDYNFAAWNHIEQNHEGSVSTCDDCTTVGIQQAA